MVRFFIFCVGFMLVTPVWANTDNTHVTTTAQCGTLYNQNTDPCSFKLDGVRYVIQPNGAGVRKDKSNAKFALTVPGRDSITVLHYGMYKGDPIFVYETEDGESTASYIVRLDGKSMRKKWVTDLGGFNTATGLIQNGYLYQTAIGLVAKLDLETGKFIWMHSNLYDRAYFSFNSFETPAKKGNDVVFMEVIQSGVAYDKPRAISVSDADGIIRVGKPVFSR